MIMRYRYLLLTLVAVLSLMSCSSTRKAARQTIPTTSGWNAGDCVTQRCNMVLKSGNRSVSLGGSLRMKRDDVIQMNLTYGFLNIGVGTLELTQDSVMFVSRMTKQYTRSSYDEVSQLLGKNIGFMDIQKYFWGEGGEGKTAVMSWKYSGFTDMDNGRKLPTGLEVNVSASGHSADATIQLSNPREDSEWNQRTKINEKSYDRLTLEQVARLLLNIVNKI